MELALFVVTFHDPDDEQGERAAGWLTSPAAGLRVLQMLKDADALDRVRFGPHNLETRFLRLAESSRRLARAWELLAATSADHSVEGSAARAVRCAGPRAVTGGVQDLGRPGSGSPGSWSSLRPTRTTASMHTTA